VSRPRRHPTWSGALTRPLAAVIPVEHRRTATRAIKAIHTAAFAIISTAILVFAWDGLLGRWSRRARLAATIAIAESVVYASNDQVCPLTPLAEALGAESGTVTDLYLPRWASDRVPLIGGSTLLVGMALHLVAWGRRAGHARRRRHCLA
jgi:hypothetical protein